MTYESFNAITRRSTLKGIGAGVTAPVAPGYLRAQSSETIKIGFIGETGILPQSNG